MKKWPMVIFLFVAHGMLYGANDDNRRIGTIDVRETLQQADDSMVIRFSTTIPANVDVQILPDHFVFYGASMTWPSGITYSTTPAKNNGGRLWWGIQGIESQNNETTIQRLHISFNTAASTTTDTYIKQGEWWPPRDWPFVYQGTVTVRSTGTFKIGGIIITEKSR